MTMRQQPEALTGPDRSLANQVAADNRNHNFQQRAAAAATKGFTPGKSSLSGVLDQTQS